MSHEKFTLLSPFFAFFPVVLGRDCGRKNCSTLKASFLTRVYEDNREANCKGTEEGKAVRRLRTRVIAVLAEER
jgi:hypothetical protein